MNDIKKELAQAGLVGEFGQPLGSSIAEDTCWPSCDNCTNSSCSSSCANGCPNSGQGDR